jgi:hypothetical protein
MRTQKPLVGGAVSDLFLDPHVSRAFQLFNEIAGEHGPKEAERAFTAVLHAWKRKGKRGRGRPKNAPKVRLQDALLLTTAQIMRSQNPKARDTEIARKYLFIIERKKSSSTEAVKSTARALGRARRRAASKTK